MTYRVRQCIVEAKFMLEGKYYRYRNIGEFVPMHPRHCARRLSFAGNFSKTGEQISTKFSMQSADDIRAGIENVWFKLLKSVGVSGCVAKMSFFRLDPPTLSKYGVKACLRR